LAYNILVIKLQLGAAGTLQVLNRFFWRKYFRYCRY